MEIDEASGAAIPRRAALALWGMNRDLRGQTLSTAQQLIRASVEARLLLTDGSEDEQGLEVAHEALFRNWPLLCDWIAERKDQFLMRKRLQRDAAEWHRRGRPEAFRWPDPLALEAGAMIRALPYQPTKQERDFLGPVHKEEMLGLIHEADTSHETRASIRRSLGIAGR